MFKREDYKSCKTRELWDLHFRTRVQPKQPEKQVVVAPPRPVETLVEEPKTQEPVKKEPKPDLEQTVQEEPGNIFEDIIPPEMPQEPAQPKTPVIEADFTIVQEKPAVRTYNLHDMRNVLHNYGIIGSKKPGVTIATALFGGIPLLVFGPSGGGKTYNVDAVFELIRPEDYLKIEFATPSALFRAQDEINQRKQLYLSELHKTWDNQATRDIFKTLLEKKRSTKLIADRKNGYLKFELEPINVTSTIADEYISLEEFCQGYTELLRRLAVIHLEPTPDHIGEVNQEKSERWISPESDGCSLTSLEDAMKGHLRASFYDSNAEVVIPYAPLINEQIPNTQKSMGYKDHFFNFIAALAKYHHQDRATVEIEGKQYIVAAVEDCKYAYELFFPDFINVLQILATEQEKDKYNGGFNPEQTPNWEAVFSSGYHALKHHEKAAGLRRADPKLAEQWYDLQVSKGTIDYIDIEDGSKKQLIDVSSRLTEANPNGTDFKRIQASQS